MGFFTLVERIILSKHSIILSMSDSSVISSMERFSELRLNVATWVIWFVFLGGLKFSFDIRPLTHAGWAWVRV